MSWCFCQKSTGVVVDIPKQIREKMRNIPLIYPNTRFSCILSDVGDLIVMNPPEEMVSASLLSTVSSLKRSAVVFASSLSQDGCPVIHLTGNSHMFSCYDIGPFLLAFYTEIDSDKFSTFDVAACDSRIFDLVIELRLILQNAVVIRAESSI